MVADIETVFDELVLIDKVNVVENEVAHEVVLEVEVDILVRELAVMLVVVDDVDITPALTYDTIIGLHLDEVEVNTVAR